MLDRGWISPRYPCWRDGWQTPWWCLRFMYFRGGPLFSGQSRGFVVDKPPLSTPPFSSNWSGNPSMQFSEMGPTPECQNYKAQLRSQVLPYFFTRAKKFIGRGQLTLGWTIKKFLHHPLEFCLWKHYKIRNWCNPCNPRAINENNKTPT